MHVNSNPAGHTDLLTFEEFKLKIFSEFRVFIVKGILNLIHQLRINLYEQVRAEQPDQHRLELLQSVFNIFDQLLAEGGKERKIIFPQMLEKIQKDSLDYYKEKKAGWNLEDCPEYFKLFEHLSTQETQIFEFALQDADGLKFISREVTKLIFKEFLLDYKEILINSNFGFHHMIKTKNYEVIFFFIKLLSKVKRTYQEFGDDLKFLQKEFEKIIIKDLDKILESFSSALSSEKDHKKKIKLLKVSFNSTRV